MIELAIASGVVAVGAIAVNKLHHEPHPAHPIEAPPLSPAGDADLPCPWCHAATAEDDANCPSCGQRFG